MACKQKILIITHEFHPKRGGIAIYTEETAKALQTLGYEVTVWAPQAASTTAQAFNFNIEAIPNNGSLAWPCRLKTAKKIRQQAQAYSESIVYLPEPGPILTLMYQQLCRLPTSRKLVLTLHGSEILRFSKTPHRKYLFKQVLAKADRIGVVSQYTHNLLAQHFPGFENKTCIVSGALRSDIALKQRIPAQASNKMRLLTVGRLHPRKGQHLVIDALSQLPVDVRNNIEYIIAGPVVKNRYYDKLTASIKNKNLQVTFKQNVSDSMLSELYQSSNIFIMTSTQEGVSVEGFGLVYLEAAAHSLPIIARAVGGAAEAVKHDFNGWCVPPEPASALNETILKLVQDTAAQKRLGDNGHLRVQELSWKANVHKLFDDLF